ncbi:MAG: hypothetical protein ACI4TG_06320 [Ruminococcus sp.]
MIRYGTYSEPLTPKKQIFASENYGMIEKFLSAKRLSFDEWYDVLALKYLKSVKKYLKSVKKWFARPDLHRYTFYTIVKTDFHYEILTELNKQKQQPTAISLYEEMPDTDGIAPELAQLMAANHVTPQQIQQVVGARGYFPADMPVQNYPPDFVQGCLVAAWQQVYSMIQAQTT